MKILLIILLLTLTGCQNIGGEPINKDVVITELNVKITDLEAELESVKNMRAKTCIDERENKVELDVNSNNLIKYVTKDGMVLIPVTSCK